MYIPDSKGGEMKQSFFIVLIALSCFGVIPKEFYKIANSKYFSYLDNKIDSFTCEVEDVTLKSIKESIDWNSTDVSCKRFATEASYENRSHSSSESILNLTPKVNFDNLTQVDLHKKLLNYNRKILSEVRGFNATVKGFYFTSTYFDTTGFAKDRLEETDSGFVYRFFGKDSYKVFLNKEYLVTSWVDDVKTKKGLIHTVISPTFIDYKGKALISGYQVDVAYGKLTSDVSIEYYLDGELPLLKKVTITTQMRGRESGTELNFTHYKKKSK